MNNMKNFVQLMGYIGIAPEEKTFDNGNTIVRFRLATTENYKDKNNTWQQHTTWHTIIAWNKLAERMHKQLHKGDLIMLQGKLSNREYENQQGEKRFVTEIIAQQFISLDKKESNVQNDPSDAFFKNLTTDYVFEESTFTDDYDLH